MRFVLQTDGANSYYSGVDPNDSGDPCFYTSNVAEAVVFKLEIDGATAAITPDLPRGSTKWKPVPVKLSVES